MQRNAENPTEAFLLLGDKFRKYGGLDAAKKVKLETRDGLSLAEIRETLRSVFGISLSLEEMTAGGYLDSVSTEAVQGRGLALDLCLKSFHVFYFFRIRGL